MIARMPVLRPRPLTSRPRLFTFRGSIQHCTVYTIAVSVSFPEFLPATCSHVLVVCLSDLLVSLRLQRLVQTCTSRARVPIHTARPRQPERRTSEVLKGRLDQNQ